MKKKENFRMLRYFIDQLRRSVAECSKQSNHIDADCLACFTAGRAIKELEALLDILGRWSDLRDDIERERRNSPVGRPLKRLRFDSSLQRWVKEPMAGTKTRLRCKGESNE